MPFIVIKNKSHENQSDTKAGIKAIAEQLAAANPGVQYDIFKLVAQTSAPQPVVPAVVATTVDVVDPTTP